MIVVTLGHRLTSDAIHPHLERRVDTGLAAFRATDARTLIFTGGSTGTRTNSDAATERTECEAMRAYAIERGADPDSIRLGDPPADVDDHIRLEDRALDTVGNGYFTRRLVDRLDDDVETVFVVTADYHAPRAAYVFERCFGEEYEIDATHVVETGVTPEQAGERRRLERNRRFFEPVTPGDVDAIERRLREVHDLYGPAAGRT